MFKDLCAGHEVEVFLLIVILILSIGKGGGALLLQLLKRIIGKEMVTVNVGAGEQTASLNEIDRAILAGHACLIPENCPKHGEEMQRSLQNQKDIAALETQHNVDREMFWKELRGIRRGIACITNGLLAKQIIDPRDMPRED